MFARLGHIVTRFRIPIIVAWIAVAVVVTLVAPNIDEVASSDQADFLPSSAPFIHADEVYKDTFPDTYFPTNTVVVIDASAGGGIPLTESGGVDTTTGAGQLIAELEAWLNGPDKPETVGSVLAPTTSDTAVALMMSDDHNVTMVMINLTSTGTEPATEETLKTIDTWLAAHALPGVETYQTGAAPIISNTVESVAVSVDRTIWVTIILVVLILMAVYRSPVSPIVPLLTVTIAYLITRGIAAYIGANFITITSYANILLVVVLYGAGTDYCLFLISRFREEMADQIGVTKATRNTIEAVSETITSSAGTIFVGFMAMALSEMGIFASSGPVLAIGIVITALAGLTFSPALLATFGERAFWPGHAKHRDVGRFYEQTSKFVSNRPLITVIVIVAIMLPLSIVGLNAQPSYNMLGDLPGDAGAVLGFATLEESMGPGNVMPLTVVVNGREPDEVASEIVQLTAELAAMEGIADVRSLNDPLGQHHASYRGILQVDTQLNLALSMMSGGASSMANLDMQQLPALLTGLKDYFAAIAAAFPQVADDPNLVSIQSMLDNPFSLAMNLDGFSAALDGLAGRFSADAADPIENPYLMPTALLGSVASLPDSSLSGMMDQLVSTYLGEGETAYKLDVILADSPNSYAAMDTVTAIRTLLTSYERPNGDAIVSGASVLITDIRATIDRDTTRTIGLVLLGIFIVLLIMLRSLVAPLYLIATVLLSFAFTLGLTNVVFKALWGIEGLTWYVPFFIFVFLVALGIDYSIFVFGRIKEEVAHHGMREGIHVAVARTGSIITSAGIILAGTFGALMFGEIKGLAELGFAVAAGVLIDTFVVRTMLVPALTTLFGRWAWWPGGVPGAKAGRAQPQPQAVPQAGD